VEADRLTSHATRLEHSSQVLICIGEGFEDSDEICGAVVSVRRHADRLSLWTKSVNNDKVCVRIGYVEKILVCFVTVSVRNKAMLASHRKEWKEALGLEANEIIGFQAHSDALQTNSSFSNKDMYSV
jgi:Zn ribbon nucleic-acid-binding protein